jgi:membrane-associated protease RseP (regulator of RpoE activity)
MPDHQPPPLEYQIFDPDRQEIRVVVIHPPRRRYWLHALLFLATIFTTLCVGAGMQYNFDNNLAAFTGLTDYWPWDWIFHDLRQLALGIPFSACLLGILTAHEFGHYVLCVRRRVYATLPFFIPAPTVIGTLGAFIRIRSPIRSRADLFDIGIAGPIAGFMVAIPVLFFGLLASKPLTVDTSHAGYTLGLPLIFRLGHWILATMGSHGAAVQFDVTQLYLHPVAIAAWFGMFATALNLIPGGQLDGGHIIFALKPRLHRPVSWLAILILLPLSWFLWAGWLLWAVILRMTGGTHPDVPLSPGLGKKRWVLAAFGLFMLIVTLIPAPFHEQGLGKILQDLRNERMKQHSQPSK